MIALVFVGIFTLAFFTPASNDTWWHLQAGRVTLQRREILRTDLFSYTRHGDPWINHSWLGQVIMYVIFESFSWVGMKIWAGILVVITFVLVYLQMEGGVVLRGPLLTLAAVTAMPAWSLRPKMFSLVLLAVVTYLLHFYRSLLRPGLATAALNNRPWRKALLWLLPLLFVAWANLHGGYPLGLMVLLAFLVGEAGNRLALKRGLVDSRDILEWREIGVVAGATIVAGLSLAATPYATRLWTHPWNVVTTFQGEISEWSSPDFHQVIVWPFAAFLLLTLATLGASNRRIDLVDLAMLGLFSALALWARRNIGPFVVVATPVLSQHLAPVLEDDLQITLDHYEAVPSWVNWVMLIIIVLAGVIGCRTGIDAFGLDWQPVEAVEWIKTNRYNLEEMERAGRIFNLYDWGGYLIWQLWPQYQVFVDGRHTLFAGDPLREYGHVMDGGAETSDVLQKYDVDLVLVPLGTPAMIRLECLDWREVYRDEIAIIFTRQGTPGGCFRGVLSRAQEDRKAQFGGE